MLVAVTAAMTACTASPSRVATSSPSATSASAAPTGAAPAAGSSSPPGGSSSAASTPVHVSLTLSDGQQVGVGMPIIATFTRKITDATAFQAATAVTVDGTPAAGAWYFEYSDPASGHAMEAHYRLATYWPAHARIHLELPVQGVSAGAGLAFDNNLTLDVSTGAAHVAVVDKVTHRLTLTVDGTQQGSYPVSLGGAKTPTFSGTKVIMEKLPTVCMHDVNNTYYECGIKDDLRLTYSGEYLHAAPWNVANITHGVDSSNGCTNLLPADAATLYGILNIGDVVQYPNADGGRMQLGQGYGDWNLTWATWQSGGAVATR